MRRVRMGMTPLLVLLILLMGCGDAAREISVPVANDAAGTHPFLADPLKFHELAELFKNDAPLNGLPTEFCNSCLELSRKAKNVLSDPSLSDEVDYLANSFCRIMPSDLKVKCIETVEMNKHEAIVFLQDAVIEEKFCYDSGFCPDKAHKSPMSKTELLTAFRQLTKMLNKLKKGLPTETASRLLNSATTFTKNMELGSNGTCTACRSVLSKVRNELDDPDKQLKIITSLLKACEVEVFVNRCKKLVFAYGPLVISNLQKIVNMDLCSMVHICEDPRNQTSHTNMINFGKSGLRSQSEVAKLDVM